MAITLKKIYDEKRTSFVIISCFFVISCIFRIIMNITNADLSSFFDELLHWNLAKSIATGNGILFRGLPVQRYDILYSLVLSIVIHVNNEAIAYQAALVLNAILMSSAIFPAYLISRKLYLGSMDACILSVFSISITEMVYTYGILQENLFYPVCLWYLVVFLYAVEHQEKKRNAVFLGLMAFVVYTVKEFGLALFVGTVLFLVFDVIQHRKEKKHIIFLGIYIASFSFIWIGYRKILDVAFFSDLSVSQSVADSVVHNVFEVLKDFDLFLQTLYPVMVYVLLAILCFGIFTILVPITQWNKMDALAKKFFVLLLMILITHIGVICVLITKSENPNSLDIRFHYRYIFYLIMPFFAIFWNSIKNFQKNVTLGKLLILFVLLLVQINIIPVLGSKNDAPCVRILYWFQDSELEYRMLVSIIIGFIAFIYCMLYYKKIKISKYGLLIILSVVSIFSTSEFYMEINLNKDRMAEAKAEIYRINEYLKKEKIETVWVLGSNDYETFYLEANLQFPYYLIDKDEFIKNNAAEKVYALGFRTNTYLDYNTIVPDVIISTGMRNSSQGDLSTKLNLSNYTIFEMSGAETDLSTLQIISGRTGDNWVTNSGMIYIGGTLGIDSETIKLVIDTHRTYNAEIIVKDSTGHESVIYATPTKTPYLVNIYKNSGEMAYTITLSTSYSFIPGNGDNRSLSFRLFEVEKFNLTEPIISGYSDCCKYVPHGLRCHNAQYPVGGQKSENARTYPSIFQNKPYSELR